MLNEKLELRNASIEDSRLFYEWANEESVRKNSLNSDKIIWEKHFKWFTNRLSSNSKLFVLLMSNKPVGQIRFDLNNDFWEIDYSIDKHFRGFGLGKKIIELSFTKFNLGDKLRAIVKRENISSRKVFEKLSFTQKIGSNSDLLIFEIEIN
jgi:RimJ/RimL family protein N-acetyltransferase